jgi:hypothetical protein
MRTMWLARLVCLWLALLCVCVWVYVCVCVCLCLSLCLRCLCLRVTLRVCLWLALLSVCVWRSSCSRESLCVRSAPLTNTRNCVYEVLLSLYCVCVFVSANVSVCLCLQMLLFGLRACASDMSYGEEDTCHMGKRIHVIWGGGYILNACASDRWARIKFAAILSLYLCYTLNPQIQTLSQYTHTQTHTLTHTHTNTHTHTHTHTHTCGNRHSLNITVFGCARQTVHANQ